MGKRVPSRRARGRGRGDAVEDRETERALRQGGRGGGARRRPDGQPHEQLVWTPIARARGREDRSVFDRGGPWALGGELKPDRVGEVDRADGGLVPVEHAGPPVGALQPAGSLVSSGHSRGALGVELREHRRADGDVDARVERARERSAEGVEPRRRNLEKAEQKSCPLGPELRSARGRFPLALGRRNGVRGAAPSAVLTTK